MVVCLDYIKNQEQRLKLSGPEHKLGRTEWAELQEAVAHATVADYERGKARVHKGFLAAYLRVRDEVRLMALQDLAGSSCLAVTANFRAAYSRQMT